MLYKCVRWKKLCYKKIFYELSDLLVVKVVQHFYAQKFRLWVDV